MSPSRSLLHVRFVAVAMLLVFAVNVCCGRAAADGGTLATSPRPIGPADEAAPDRSTKASPAQSCLQSAKPSVDVPAPGRAPTILILHRKELSQPDKLPLPCVGWDHISVSDRVVELLASYRSGGDIDDLLHRVGSISALTRVRYWSYTSQRWRPLVFEASALSARDAGARRSDFSTAELRAGGTLYYWVRDSRLGEIVYALHIVIRTRTELVVTTENASEIRFLGLPVLGSGDLQTAEVIEETAPGVWSARILTRTLNAGSLFANAVDGSLVQRVEAIYRTISGTPIDPNSRP